MMKNIIKCPRIQGVPLLAVSIATTYFSLTTAIFTQYITVIWSFGVILLDFCVFSAQHYIRIVKFVKNSTFLHIFKVGQMTDPYLHGYHSNQLFSNLYDMRYPSYMHTIYTGAIQLLFLKPICLLKALFCYFPKTHAFGLVAMVTMFLSNHLFSPFMKS